MPDPLTVFERFSSNRARAPRKPVERPSDGCAEDKSRRASVRLGPEELMLLCAGIASIAVASFLLGRYSRVRTEPLQDVHGAEEERVERFPLEDLQRALEPAPLRYALCAGVYATEREAGARASFFEARGLGSRVLESEEGFVVAVGEFADPSEAKCSPIGREIHSSRTVRLP